MRAGEGAKSELGGGVPVDVELQKLLHKKARRNAVAGGPVKWNTLAWNWLHQSFFYLNPTDMAFKVFFEVVLFSTCFGLLALVGSSLLAKVALSFVFAHTLNWIINGNFWACLLSAFPSQRNRGAEQTKSYVNAMATRLRASDAVVAMMLLGSVCRSKWHNRSDIDVRLLRQRGVKAALRAVALTFRERIIAVLQREPLEIYLADSVAFLAKKRRDEVPLFLICRVPEVIPFEFAAIHELSSLESSDGEAGASQADSAGRSPVD